MANGSYSIYSESLLKSKAVSLSKVHSWDFPFSHPCLGSAELTHPFLGSAELTHPCLEYAILNHSLMVRIYCNYTHIHAKGILFLFQNNVSIKICILPLEKCYLLSVSQSTALK